jgi:hypothetical protein
MPSATIRALVDPQLCATLQVTFIRRFLSDCTIMIHNLMSNGASSWHKVMHVISLHSVAPHVLNGSYIIDAASQRLTVTCLYVMLIWLLVVCL